MLQRLQISNYALIDNVDVTFAPGFNVITGETGAGKSIMLGALSLILGGRADTRVVRSHQAKSVIEATFTCSNNPQLQQFCTDNDIDWLDDTMILRREITPSGRSRTFINDTPVTVSQLREVAIHLVDIHSQHQNLLLADPAFQLEVIDRLGSNASRLEAYKTRYRQLRTAAKALKAAKEQLRQNRDDEEFTRYQLDQLKALNLQSGEQEELEQRRDLLENLTDVKSRLDNATQNLDGSVSSINEAIASITPLAATLPDGAELLRRLESASIEVKDIAETLTDFNDDLDADPGELDMIDERLNAIYAQQNRHHVDSVDALIKIRDNLAAKLASLDDADNNIADLERETRRAMALVKESAADLTTARKQAAENLARQLRETAAPLGMKNLNVDIRVSPTDINATGADKVEFLFSFNKNQPLLPVADTASGGEISRLMLSLKAIIGRHIALPSIIFDEIDTGVSGDIAGRMGQMMADIGSRIQVIAITHLPQVAARGSSHFKVYKEDDDTATHTHISPLTPEQRIDELSIMLSGSKNDDTARNAARTLLKQQ